MAKVSKIELHRRAFIIHFVVYLLVMSGLGAINHIYSPATLWFIYPLIGWGIGIAMHFLFSVVWVKDSSAQTKEEWKKEGSFRAFIIHVAIYLMVNTLLFTINLTNSPETLWAAFPAVGWGFGVVIHMVFTMLWRNKTDSHKA